MLQVGDLKMSFHIRVGARGIVINNGKILLNEFGGGEYYNIPGGGVEPGETVKQAVAREIFEESGLNVTVGELIYVLEYEPNTCRFIYGKKPQISLVFRCFLNGDDKIKLPSIPDIDPDNPKMTSEAKWVRIYDLENINYVPYIHEKLMEYIKTNRFEPVFIEEPLKKKN
jgi:8-oxo-dGTP diphosphatase